MEEQTKKNVKKNCLSDYKLQLVNLPWVAKRKKVFSNFQKYKALDVPISSLQILTYY